MVCYGLVWFGMVWYGLRGSARHLKLTSIWFEPKLTIKYFEEFSGRGGGWGGGLSRSSNPNPSVSSRDLIWTLNLEDMTENY